MKLHADRDACEAHGQCAMVDDELFPLDDDGYTTLGTAHEVPSDKEQAARLGAAACPVLALRVE